MKRAFVLVSLLLPGLVTGCASDKDLQAVRADTQALERQSSERQQTVEARLQNLSDRVIQFEKSQTDTRRDLARTAATLDELRIQLQRIKGDIDETQHQFRRGTAGGGGVSSTKLSDFETRLGDIEKQFPPRKGATPPPVPQTKPELEPAPPAKLEPAPPASFTTDTFPTTPAPPASPSGPVQPPQPATPPQPPTPRVAALPPTIPPTRPPTTPPPVENNAADQLFQRGVKEYKDRNYETAIVNLRQYLKQSPKSSQAGTAQFIIGEALYAQKQYDSAIVAYDEVVQKYPKDTNIAASILKQAYAFAELKDVRNARFLLQQVQKKFPDTPQAQQAGEKLKQLGR